MPVRVEWTRFLIVTLVLSVVIFVVDIGFHQHLAPKIFGDYPAADYPSRPGSEITGTLFGFLFLTYIVQMPMFCFLFMRLYKERSVSNAIWWGIWGGFFVVIPNMQFFVAVDHTTAKMLIIQVIEGIFLMALLTALFSIFYKPKSG